MNKIIVPIAAKENFPFLKTKFSHTKEEQERMEISEDSDTFEEVISHSNNKIEKLCEKNSDNSVSESNSGDTIVCNSLGNAVEKMPKNTRIHMSENITPGNASSSAEYQIVSLNVKNMTETTVINTTYNLISQSSVRDIERKKDIATCVQNTSSPFLLSDGIDKSRVVVQVLRSNARNCIESRTVFENRSPENQNVSNFREEVLQMLSKVPAVENNAEIISKGMDDVTNALNGTDNVTNTLNDTDNKSVDDVTNGMNVSNSIKEVTPQYQNLSHIVKNRKRCNLKYFFLNGRGLRLCEIQHVALNLKNASSGLLRILHYVLFDTYGLCNNNVQLNRTRKNILLFCGYPFVRNSNEFIKKRNCLARLPLPILAEMHKILIGNNCTARDDMVTQLVEFFMEPYELKAPVISHKKNQKVPSEDEYVNLMEIAQRTSLPIVMVKKLNEDDIIKLQNQVKLESKSEESVSLDKYEQPCYILKGPGLKLKSFPKIVSYINSAKKRIIQILHFILYGRMESEEMCRRNILEFSGFLPCQKAFITQGLDMLNKVSQIDLYQLCKILCLHAKTNARTRKIKKIMQFLSAPKPIKYRYFQRSKKKEYSNSSTKVNRSKSYFEKSEDANSSQLNFAKPCSSNKTECADSPKLQNFNNRYSENAFGPRLRDFNNICSNIECAAPSDLTELNDLLFVKPSDESEIHQRILDFTRFQFQVNSMEYHYRKTLMHYMGFCVIRKIAQMLNIENCDRIINQDELSASILNFLMEMKIPGSHFQKVSHPKSVLEDIKKTELFKENSKSQISQVSEKDTKKSLSFVNSAKTVQSHSISNHPHSTEMQTPSYHKTVQKCKTDVFIHRLSKASEESEKEYDSSPNAATTEDNSTPLRTLLHHPSDQELKQEVGKIIQKDLWSITMGDLVQKVYLCYPHLNINYRESFIKTEARQMLSQLRSNAVDTLNNMHCKMPDNVL